jgi:acetyl-CoA synthetase
MACVVKEIGAFARPQDIQFSQTLPKTRSGKIMRRVLRQIASGQEISGDLSTIENLEFLKETQS